MAAPAAPQDRKKKRSGNPANRAVSSAKAWKSQNGGSQVAKIELPSGAVVKVRQVGPEAFLSQGIIPESLLPLVIDAVEEKEGKRPRKGKKQPDVIKQMFASGGDSGGLQGFLMMMDRVLAYAVLEPPVEMPPSCDVVVNGKPCGLYNTPDVSIHRNKGVEGFHEYSAPEKDEDIVYADEVSLEDKQEVMEFAMGGGTSDLEPFREGPGATVEGLGS